MSKVTISEVAKAAGVSTMTVSRVVNQKGATGQRTEEKVLKAIASLGYRPSKIARSLTTNKTNTIGLVIPDINNPFFPEIVAGAEEAAWKAGYSLVLYNSNENQERELEAVELLEDMRVDGIILACSRLPDNELLEKIESHSAVVLINRFLTAPKVATVSVDYTYGAMLAVNHLLTSGHEHIGFVGGTEESHSTQAHRTGFITALETRNLDANPRYMVYSQPNESAIQEAVMGLLERQPEITALTCYNDMAAIGALQAALELGRRVPEDLAIIGNDNIRMASLINPSLTTIGISKHDIGSNALELLLASMSGEVTDKHLLFKPKLIVRQSAPNI